MAHVVRMPGISADADSAVLVEWSVEPGTSVRKDDVVATVETDKAVVDIVAEADGTLLKTFAAAGETVPIGGPMAVLLAPGEKEGDEASLLAELGLGEEAARPDGQTDPPVDPADPDTVGRGPQSDGPLEAIDEDRSQDEVARGTSGTTGRTADGLARPLGQAGTNGHRGTNGHDTPDPQGGRVFATPLVRRMAAEAGFALAGVRGTGPNGRIRLRDLEAAQAAGIAQVAAQDRLQETPQAPAALTAPAPAPAPRTQAPAGTAPAAATVGAWTDEPASRFRMAVARGLTASKQNVPHFYLKATCRVDELLELRARVNAGGPSKITINDFVVKAAALALRRVPEMNVSWTGDAVRHFHDVDVAVAMATERGLVVPVVRGAASLSLSGVSAAVKDLAAKAAGNTLQQHQMEGGSLAISNLGMYGVEEFSAIINPPQAGILAVGAVVPQAVEGPDGELALGRCMTVVLSADHRPVDGALAARWLAAFKHLIENPFQIVV